MIPPSSHLYENDQHSNPIPYSPSRSHTSANAIPPSLLHFPPPISVSSSSRNQRFLLESTQDALLDSNSSLHGSLVDYSNIPGVDPGYMFDSRLRPHNSSSPNLSRQHSGIQEAVDSIVYRPALKIEVPGSPSSNSNQQIKTPTPFRLAIPQSQTQFQSTPANQYHQQEYYSQPQAQPQPQPLSSRSRLSALPITEFDSLSSRGQRPMLGDFAPPPVDYSKFSQTPQHQPNQNNYRHFDSNISKTPQFGRRSIRPANESLNVPSRPMAAFASPRSAREKLGNLVDFLEHNSNQTKPKKSSPSREFASDDSFSESEFSGDSSDKDFSRSSSIDLPKAHRLFQPPLSRPTSDFRSENYKYFASADQSEIQPKVSWGSASNSYSSTPQSNVRHLSKPYAAGGISRISSPRIAPPTVVNTPMEQSPALHTSSLRPNFPNQLHRGQSITPSPLSIAGRAFFNDGSRSQFQAPPQSQNPYMIAKKFYSAAFSDSGQTLNQPLVEENHHRNQFY